MNKQDILRGCFDTFAPHIPPGVYTLPEVGALITDALDGKDLDLRT